MARLEYMIMNAIEMEELPADLNLALFVPPRIFVSLTPIPRQYLEAHLNAVAKYLNERAINPAPVRYKDHIRRIKESLNV